MSVTIALDAMGGDDAPGMVIEGAIRAARRNPEVAFILVGQEDAISEQLGKQNGERSRFQIHPASQVVGMAEKPSVALRKKKDSSMRVGANLVKAGTADAFVSAGNTGALMATARFVLKMLPQVDRPAIASLLPAIESDTLMLDLGANVDCTAEHLVQFATMGSVFAQVIMGLEKPRVGLLNIGEEEVKGNGVVKEAGEILKRTSDTFIGSVEGDDIFKGPVDVVVCDGFVGNVSLKTSEGVAQMITHMLKESFRSSLMAKLGYFFVRPALNRFRDRFDHRRYNGAILLGLNGVV
ncbi:MAG: phosphate acyltransferase PlsX, partial [Magnetococcales bacterium]|nr:phosphate acyltransferase PlsX [Magnetococcales bacterium]